jgi:hypothetical protein
MKRYLSGVGHANASAEDSPADGLFLGRVERVQYCRQGQKPYYLLLFNVLEPKSLAGHRFSARLYCTPKALWKLNWFLRDFGYDSELLEQDEIDETHLVGLSGVIKTARTVLNGTCVLAIDGFAPSSQWQELIRGQRDQATGTGAGS